MSLRIEVKGTELFDERNGKFIDVKPSVLILEHSLMSISLWESKYHIPFLTEEEKTNEQLEYYFECMTINRNNLDSSVYKGLTASQQNEILLYMKDPMTATWFGNGGKTKGRAKKEIITSEVIYGWMILLGIPHEYEKWHLNRLLTLIQVCKELNGDPKKNKMSKKEIIRNNDAINEMRRKAMNSKG